MTVAANALRRHAIVRARDHIGGERPMVVLSDAPGAYATLGHVQDAERRKRDMPGWVRVSPAHTGGGLTQASFLTLKMSSPSTAQLAAPHGALIGPLPVGELWLGVLKQRSDDALFWVNIGAIRNHYVQKFSRERLRFDPTDKHHAGWRPTLHLEPLGNV